MMGGYMNRILRVNLSTREYSVEPIAEALIKNFIGGRGLGAKMLYDDLSAGVDPLSPENEIIFVAGPLAGTAAQSFGRWSIFFKSPLTGGYFQSTGGGFFASEMKFAGYDAIVVTGKADKPVYLWINEEKVEFRDASYLWGFTNEETHVLIREELNDPFVRIASIGPAGENLVRFAGVFSDRHAAGRGGGGAVMGSKNLKAIAIRGRKTVPIAMPEAFQEAIKFEIATYRAHPAFESFSRTGTQIAEFTNLLGMFPTRNFREGVLPNWEAIQGSEFDKLRVRKTGCHNCVIHCVNISKAYHGPFKGAWSEGPEYETIWAFTGPIVVSEPGLTIAADRLCDELGLDTISTGQAIGFAYELFEKGLITTQDTGGLELRYGDFKPVLQLIRQIAYKEQLGALLSEGVREAARRIGRGAEHYAIHVKGLELPAYDPRGAKAHGLNLLTANIGADHNYGYSGQEIFGAPIPKEVDRFEVQGKGELAKFNQDMVAFLETGIMCTFPASMMMVNEEVYSKLIYAATGVEEFKDPAYMWIVGERIYNLERMFNVREGFGKKDDVMPQRIVTEPMPDGPSKGQVFEQDELLRQYYAARGWDLETGIPTLEKLRELGLAQR
ncbi:aldehyde ferredoxin oxidoreductase family protein [Coprothermobacteraceae bacterium]|nr:aldehyde ferredoxin oxidoreductase family protein [Coprothermobacteraceae bacterium]